ncbi:MAG: hypothetical protein GX790_08730 [Syntrophomonadaceae bacterium]|nr:hypothetical protein [Syntrophomonadaceae bacterium]
MLAAIRLLIIHVFAALAIWLCTYIAGLDIILSLVYLVVISMEISSIKNESLLTKGVTALLWLGIPTLLSIITSFRLSNIGIFILEFWFTPILPILSLKPYVFESGRPLYYYALIWLPVLMAVHFFLLTRRRDGGFTIK